MLKFSEFQIEPLQENVATSDVQYVEKYLNALYAKIKLGFNFSNHFMERVNDSRNVPPINKQELLVFYGKLFEKHKDDLMKLRPEEEVLISNEQMQLHSPIVLKQGNRSNFIRVKTIIRKKKYYSDDFDNKRIYV